MKHLIELSRLDLDCVGTMDNGWMAFARRSKAAMVVLCFKLDHALMAVLNKANDTCIEACTCQYNCAVERNI